MHRDSSVDCHLGRLYNFIFLFFYFHSVKMDLMPERERATLLTSTHHKCTNPMALIVRKASVACDRKLLFQTNIEQLEVNDNGTMCSVTAHLAPSIRLSDRLSF